MNRLLGNRTVILSMAIMLGSCAQTSHDDSAVSCTAGSGVSSRSMSQKAGSDYDGRWEWLQTCGGIAGICHTPESTGDDAVLVLASTEFAYCKNDSLIASGLFAILKGNENTGDEIRYVSQSTEWPEMHFISAPEIDRLVLDEGCCDRFAMEFRRIRISS